MPTKTAERLARHIVAELYRTTGGQPQAWRSLAGISSSAETEEAVALAVASGWLLCERGHSIALTDDGRRLVER